MEVNVEKGEKEEREERGDGRDPPITAPGVHDVNTRQTHTRRVATTARENERTATPAGETTVNGTGTVVIAATADAEISMTDHLDVTVIETCLTRNPGENEGETASATGRGKNGKEAQPPHARGSLHPT